MTRIDRSDFAEAARAVSRGRFRFTRRNLFYEMVRRGSCRVPEGAGVTEPFAAFRDALAEHEGERGPLPGLVRPESIPASLDPAAIPPDVLDYAVPRAVVFESVDLCVLFALNGFHRILETALVAPPGFPQHVWRLLARQVESGVPTLLYAVHDATVRGYELAGRVRERVSRWPGATAPSVVDLGLTLPWAFRLRVPVRRLPAGRAEVTPAAAAGRAEVDRLLLAQGNLVEIEELPPARVMRWVYDRIADEAEEIGFG